VEDKQLILLYSWCIKLEICFQHTTNDLSWWQEVFWLRNRNCIITVLTYASYNYNDSGPKKFKSIKKLIYQNEHPLILLVSPDYILDDRQLTGSIQFSIFVS